MKKSFLLLAFVAAFSLLTVQAHALSLTAGDVTIHLQDATTLWTPEEENGLVGPDAVSLIPRVPNWYDYFGADPLGVAAAGTFAPDGALVGDESRSVFNVDSFEYLAQPDIILPDGQLTGLIYDLHLAGIGGFGTTVILAYTGGRAQFWLDSSPEGADEEHVINPVAGPAPLEWVEDSAVYGGAYDGFTNINLAPGGAAVDPGTSLWLDTVFLPLDGAGTTVVTVINLATGLGASTGGFLDIIGGSAAPLFAQGLGTTPLGAFYDMSFAFTTSQDPDVFYYTNTFADDGFWQISSSDPARAQIIPEPATLTLLGLGVIGMVARRRKRK